MYLALASHLTYYFQFYLVLKIFYSSKKMERIVQYNDHPSPIVNILPHFLSLNHLKVNYIHHGCASINLTIKYFLKKKYIFLYVSNKIVILLYIAVSQYYLIFSPYSHFSNCSQLKKKIGPGSSEATSITFVYVFSLLKSRAATPTPVMFVFLDSDIFDELRSVAF